MKKYLPNVVFGLESSILAIVAVFIAAFTGYCILVTVQHLLGMPQTDSAFIGHGMKLLRFTIFGGGPIFILYAIVSDIGQIAKHKNGKRKKEDTLTNIFLILVMATAIFCWSSSILHGIIAHYMHDRGEYAGVESLSLRLVISCAIVTLTSFLGLLRSKVSEPDQKFVKFLAKVNPFVR